MKLIMFDVNSYSNFGIVLEYKCNDTTNAPDYDHDYDIHLFKPNFYIQ